MRPSISALGARCTSGDAQPHGFARVADHSDACSPADRTLGSRPPVLGPERRRGLDIHNCVIGRCGAAEAPVLIRGIAGSRGDVECVDDSRLDMSEISDISLPSRGDTLPPSHLAAHPARCRHRSSCPSPRQVRRGDAMMAFSHEHHPIEQLRKIPFARDPENTRRSRPATSKTQKGPAPRDRVRGLCIGSCQGVTRQSGKVTLPAAAALPPWMRSMMASISAPIRSSRSRTVRE